MIIEGNFKYFFDNEEKTREEIEKLANYATNITVGNGVVNYFSAKKEKIDIECRLKLAEYYKEKAFKDYNLENPLTKIGDYLDKNGSHSIGIEEITNLLASPKKVKKESALALDDLKYFMINLDSTEKDLTDIIYLITAENEEDLGQRFAKIKLKEAQKEEAEYMEYLKALDEERRKSDDIEEYFPRKNKEIEKFLEYVDAYQEQNRGRVVGVEFPFDAVLTPQKSWLQYAYDNATEPVGDTEYGNKLYAEYEQKHTKSVEEREQEVIKAWNKVYDFKLPVYGTIGTPDDMKNKEIQDNGSMGFNFQKNPIMPEIGAKKGIKETDGKLHYELSWEFIEEMAKRMANNKSDKYPLYNWKKSINIQDLKDAINRHHIEVMKGNYQDDEEVLGHVVSYACNAMMLWEQLKEK